VDTQQTYDEHPAETGDLMEELKRAWIEARGAGDPEHIVGALGHACQELGDAKAYKRPTLPRDAWIGDAVLEAYRAWKRGRR